ncbi:MarR family transcriptional regulator [Acaricomes phytoseiuli]|uniref:MarR family winged helix-turn-helix transcriptional regulator n=1 Tax=Acaricomes phytoseiuli TaxID=291968 RepID=UPI0003667BAF|nr:MarR family transcriptional regulator [Acaricomes phytoseiuli]MCW1249604.1 MarR family transcriptional regulator [Acaricomes phytoseiuli]
MNDHLSPQQERAFTLLSGVIMWLPSELDAYLGSTASLSFTEYQVLRWLSKTGDLEVHMGRLAATASVTPSHLSRIIGRLEKRNLLSRSTDPSDARKTQVQLTQEGTQLVNQVEPGFATEIRRRVFDLLSEGQAEHLEDITEAILLFLKEDCLQFLPPRNGQQARPS